VCWESQNEGSRRSQWSASAFGFARQYEIVAPIARSCDSSEAVSLKVVVCQSCQFTRFTLRCMALVC
jgi:hypothetical protein